jgi:hypothetical protein
MNEEAAHEDAPDGEADGPALVHTIRLRSGWQVQPLGEGKLHTRHFGKPRTLDSNESVWLVFTHLPVGSLVRLNAILLHTHAAAGALALEITPHLGFRNAVELTCPSDEAPGEVALEIRVSR